MEGNFPITPGFLVCSACGMNTVPVCLDVDGLVADEGAGEHVSCLSRGGEEGGSNEGGILKHQSTGLDSVSEEGPEFIVNGAINSKD